MNVVVAQATEDCLIKNVHAERPGTLGWSFKWKLTTALFYLVVEAPLGGNVEVDQEIVQGLSGIFMDGKPHELPLSGERSCLLYLKPRIKEKQFEYTRSHESYAVYGCGYDMGSNELTVYLPQPIGEAVCDVPGIVRCTLTPHNVTESSGFGPWQKTRTKRDGYTLRIAFDSKPAAEEQLGVWYEFPGSAFRYPILPSMDGQALYVKSPMGNDDAPTVKSSGTGYTVVDGVR